MMVNFEFLSEPLQLVDGTVNVLCVENQKLFRGIFNAFVNGETEENRIIFSENFEPVKIKGNVCVIDDFFRLTYSNTIIKKLYEQIEKYCNYELQKETTQLKIHIVNYFEQLISAFDYDFEFNYDLSIAELLKAVSLKPNTDKSEVIGILLDYILLVNKYAPPKCFVLLNLHLYFGKEELDLFYNDIINNHIKLLLIEGVKFFETSSCENVVVYDKDFCEIVEN